MLLISLATYATHTRAHYDDLDQVLAGAGRHIASERVGSLPTDQLAQVLADVFGTPVIGEDGDLSSASAGEGRLDDPQWMHGRLTEARVLLDRAATVLPALLQYAQVLRTHAQRLELPGDALDAFAIVADRLDEACELLRHPPEGFSR